MAKTEPNPRNRATPTRVFRIDDDDEDVGYWLSRTPEERLAAQELNRQVLYGYEEAENSHRIQGVLEVFRAAPS
ncbi:MAG: hypothetical protein JNK75_01215 [Betaproteobacteria bacterium]|nr:hypothetical protein [Betaproteobacteria bacterium]